MRYYSKANKVRSKEILRGTLIDIAIKERAIFYIKIILFIIYFFVETIPLHIDILKSKECASVPEGVCSFAEVQNDICAK